MPSDLAADPTNEVMFLSFLPERDNASSGIIHARLNLNRDRGRMPRGDDSFLMDWAQMSAWGSTLSDLLLFRSDYSDIIRLF
jgi:hypothetical protein